MDWTRYKPLLDDATRRLVQLSIKSQQAAVPPGLAEVMACLDDGSIDPGDFEQVSRGLLKIITGMAEYRAIVQFTRERRDDYRALYQALGNASDDDYAAFLELTQQIAAEMVTETLFGALVAAGVLVDKRGN
jgi:hypothetical protein